MNRGALPGTSASAAEARGARATERRRVPVLARRRLLALRCLGVAAVVLGAAYVGWRVTATVGPDGLGFAFWAAELVAYVSLAFTVVMMWNRRSRDGPARPPRGTLDVFVPVCGEPVEMVRETLRAAAAIAYPHRLWLLNDGRIAGKDNWPEIDELARELNIRRLTRTEGRRGKAGNLNHALQHSNAEFVGVIDADHRVDPDFAHETLGYFEDADVALVSTPQQFELPGEDVLNNLQPFFYEHQLPAKDAANAAFSCGNGVVYRRSALEAIGGFSEWSLVEDLHTTYRLHAAGFESIYHPRAVSVGTAPSTAAGLAKQHLTWAIDSLRILFFDSPLTKRGLTLRQRAHYLQTTTQYLTAIPQLAFWIAPFMYLLLHLSAIRGSEVGVAFAATAVPYYGTVFVWLALFIGVRDTLRTAAQRTFLAPVFAVAAIRAVLGRPGARSVTDKVAAPRFSPLLVPMAALLVLTVVALGYGATVAEPRMTIGMAIAAGTTLLMLGVLTAVTPHDRLRRRLRAHAAALTVLVVLVFLVRAF